MRDAIPRIACRYTSTPPPNIHPPAPDGALPHDGIRPNNVTSRQDWSQTSRKDLRGDTDRRKLQFPTPGPERYYVTVTNYSHSARTTEPLSDNDTPALANRIQFVAIHQQVPPRATVGNHGQSFSPRTATHIDFDLIRSTSATFQRPHPP